MLQQIKTNRDQPSGLMFENLTESLYPTHPYGAVGKRLEDAIPQITRNELIQYYREQMEPDNLVIAVVGNVDSKTTQLRMTALLNALKNKTADAASKAPENFPDVPPLKQNESVEAQKPEQAATWISYGWLAPGISTNRDYITLKVINALLGQGLSSRLFVDLREKQGLAYHVSSLYPSNLKNGSFVMYIGTAPQNQEKVITGFNEQIKRLQADPVTKDELDTVKSKLIGAFALAHESNANQAFYLGLYETLGVGYMFDKHYPELIEQVTPEDIQRVARLYFNQPKVVSIVAPKTVRGADASDAH